jgi:hypothetical protein
MPKFKVEESHSRYVGLVLREANGLRHLRTRHRADTVTIESGPADEPVPHARLKRVSVHLWTLDVADHRGRWESAEVRADLDTVLGVLVHDIGWVLTPVDDDPLRTSDPEH